MHPEELKRIREQLHMGPTEFAAALGVSRVTVWRWEAGERGIPEPAARLAERLLTERRPKKRKK